MNWRKNLWVLWSAVILSSSSYTMVVPFLPLYLLDLGVGTNTVKMWSGLVFSVSFLVGAIMAPYWGRRADKTGKKRMVLRAGLSLSAVYFLGAFVRSPFELLIVRILQGFANGFFPASMAIVASSAPEDKMGYSLGLMQTAALTGGILGPLFGGVLSHLFGIRLSFIMAGTAIFIATAAVKILVVEPKRAEASQSGNMVDDLKVAFNNPMLKAMLLLLLIVQVASMVLQPLITLYVAELQGQFEGAVLTSGFVFSLAGIAGAIAAPIWGKTGNRAGFFYILIAALLGAGIINTFQFFIHSIGQFAVLQFAFGLFLAGVYPSVNTIVVQHTDINFRGRAFGLTTSATQLGAMLGPLLGGFASAWMTTKLIFVSTGVLLLTAGTLTWLLRRRLRPVKMQKDA